MTSHAFNHVSGGGVTFSNLFHGWPKDRLATVHDDPHPLSYDVCSRYYEAGPAEIDLATPFNWLRNRYWLRQAPATGVPADATVASGGTSLRRLALRLVGDALPSRGRLTAPLRAWIEDFGPDVIYTILGSNGLMQLVEQIRDAFDLPVVVHIMDDWLNNHGRGLIGRLETSRAHRRAESIIASASRRMGISPAMCEAYSERYGRPFQAFQNTIDVARWASLRQAADDRVAAPADILYIGSIFANAQARALNDVCQAVAHLNRKGRATTLTIASPTDHVSRHRETIAQNEHVDFQGPIGDDAAFFARLIKADVLMLPVNFDRASRRYIRYSMPTKVPSYLASGTPVLAYGPPDVAQIAYAREEGWGLTVEQCDVGVLADAMERLLDDQALRMALREKAVRCAMANHDCRHVREAFRCALSNTAASARASR